MRFENPIKSTLERKEIIEKLKEGREEFKEYYLKEEAERLRKAGFGVDNECRIKPSEFKKLFGEKTIEKDLNRVEEKEATFEKENPNYKETAEYIKGETLEMAKTLAFNGHWFNKKLIAVRTARYDDIFNGVDELIFDKETKFPLAAVDLSTNMKIKTKELFEKRMYEGGKVKYGFGFDENSSVEKKSYENLPLFVVSITPEELLEVNSTIIKGNLHFESLKISNNILEELSNQSEIAVNSDSISPSLRAAYEKAAQIFEKL